VSHILREVLSRVPLHQGLVGLDQFGQGLLGNLGVRLDTEFGFHSAENFLELLLRNVQHDIAEHMNEPPIAVQGEPPVAALSGQALERLVVQAEVEDGVHHPGHGEFRARSDGNQKRIARIAELLSGNALELGQRRGDLFVGVGRNATAGFVKEQADFGRNRKPRGNGQPDSGHFGQVGALAAERILHVLVAFSLGRGEEINGLMRHDITPKKFKNQYTLRPPEIQPCDGTQNRR
jgi:hypothetical protein